MVGWECCLQKGRLLLHHPVIGSAVAAVMLVFEPEPGLALEPGLQPPAVGGQGCCVSACASSGMSPKCRPDCTWNSCKSWHASLCGWPDEPPMRQHLCMHDGSCGT